MEHFVRHSLLRYAATLVIGLAVGSTACAQTPTPAGPVSVTDPSLNDPMTQALEPVRQAIARQDYAAAQTALDAAKQQNPNHPGIALYESMIQRRQGQGQAIDTQSPLRTPRAGVTPMPAPQNTPEPEINSEPEVAPPAPAPGVAADAPPPLTAADDSLAGKAKALWENEMVRYAVYGLAGLIALFLILRMLKKRRSDHTDEPEHATPASSGVMTMGGLDDHLGDEEPQGSFGSFNPGLGSTSMAGGLSASPTTPDFGLSDTPGTTGTDSPSPSFGSSPSGSSLGGSALGGGMSGYTMPSFGGDEDEEDEAPAPPPRPAAPSNPVDDDAPVSFASMQPDEPEEAPAAPPAADTPAPKAVSDEGLDALGINFGGVGDAGSEKPAAPKPFDEEETMILSGPENEPVPPPAAPQAPVNPTPTSTPSIAPGTVDLEDIFGSQPLPGTFSNAETIRESPQQASASFNDGEKVDNDSQLLSGAFSDADTLREPTQRADKLSAAPEDEDTNSKTLPTFVSAPGADNPEESAEMPPPPRQRPTADKGGESESISFEELFGSPSETAKEAPAQMEPTPAPDPTPAPAPKAEMSIEDALAATLGDMQAQAPDGAPADESAVEQVAAGSTESLDERTERMFSDQLDKARAAVAEKNWRQAVHFLSIASALHPEHEEAKQMLKDARAEKRKSEESV